MKLRVKCFCSFPQAPYFTSWGPLVLTGSLCLSRVPLNCHLQLTSHYIQPQGVPKIYHTKPYIFNDWLDGIFSIFFILFFPPSQYSCFMQSTITSNILTRLKDAKNFSYVLYRGLEDNFLDFMLSNSAACSLKSQFRSTDRSQVAEFQINCHSI